MELNLFNLYTRSLNFATFLTVICFNDLTAFRNGDMKKAIFKFPYPKMDYDTTEELYNNTEKYGLYPFKAFYYTHFQNKKTASTIVLYNNDFIVKNNRLLVATSEEID